MFAMWIRANLHLLHLPLDKNTWRVARPWMSLEQLQNELRLHKNKSLGFLVIGKYKIPDLAVHKAVAYEARMFGKITQEELDFYAQQLFEYKPEKSNSTELIQCINTYRIHQGITPIKHDKIWKRWIKHNPNMHVRITLKDMKYIIKTQFKCGGTPNGAPLPTQEVQEHIKDTILVDAHNPVLLKAIDDLKPTRKINRQQQIQTILKTYYKPNKFVQEDKTRLLFVLQSYTHFKKDDPMLEDIDLHISPRFDWAPDNYDIALDPNYAQKAYHNPLQKPFMMFHGDAWRPKQNIPWHKVLQGLERGTTNDDTIHYINNTLKDMGFTPYHPDHSVLQSIRVRGYLIGNLKGNLKGYRRTNFKKFQCSDHSSSSQKLTQIHTNAKCAPSAKATKTSANSTETPTTKSGSKRKRNSSTTNRSYTLMDFASFFGTRQSHTATEPTQGKDTHPGSHTKDTSGSKTISCAS